MTNRNAVEDNFDDVRYVEVDPNLHPDAFGKLAMVTASGNWHNGRVRHNSYMNVLQAFVQFGGMLDEIKKATWYGRPVASDNLKPEFETNCKTLDCRNMSNGEMLIWHGIVGMATEAVELVQALLAWEMSGRKVAFDFPNLGEEMGDSDWYAALIRYVIRRTDASIKDAVITKLQARFGSKFDAWMAQDENRNLSAERAILEKAAQQGEIPGMPKEVLTVAVTVDPELHAMLEQAHAECEQAMYRHKLAEDEAAALRQQLAECQQGYEELRQKHVRLTQEMRETDAKYLQRGNDMRAAADVLHPFHAMQAEGTKKSEEVLRNAVSFVKAERDEYDRRAFNLYSVTAVAKAPGNGNYDPYMRGMANGLILAQSILSGITPDYLPTPPNGYVSDYMPKEPKVVTTVHACGDLSHMESVYTGGALPQSDPKGKPQ